MLKLKHFLIIIYLEGYPEIPNQEKNFWEASPSLRIWIDVFERMHFTSFVPILLLKKCSSEKNFEFYVRNINRRINRIYKVYPGDNNFFHIIITGDHDEIKDKATLDAREEFANEINVKLKNMVKGKDIKIILKRDKSFKLETLMAAVTNTNKKISKKYLRDNCGTEYPTIPMLFNSDNKAEISDLVFKNISQSSLPLFKEIMLLSLKIKPS